MQGPLLLRGLLAPTQGSDATSWWFLPKPEVYKYTFWFGEKPSGRLPIQIRLWGDQSVQMWSPHSRIWRGCLPPLPFHNCIWGTLVVFAVVEVVLGKQPTTTVRPPRPVRQIRRGVPEQRWRPFPWRRPPWSDQFKKKSLYFYSPF
jgi:hypothetical protein